MPYFPTRLDLAATNTTSTIFADSNRFRRSFVAAARLLYDVLRWVLQGTINVHSFRPWLLPSGGKPFLIRSIRPKPLVTSDQRGIQGLVQIRNNINYILTYSNRLKGKYMMNLYVM